MVIDLSERCGLLFREFIKLVVHDTSSADHLYGGKEVGSLPSVRIQTPSRHFRDHPNGWSNSGVLGQDVRIWYPCENVLGEIVRMASCERSLPKD